MFQQPNFSMYFNVAVKMIKECNVFFGSCRWLLAALILSGSVFAEDIAVAASTASVSPELAPASVPDLSVQDVQLPEKQQAYSFSWIPADQLTSDQKEQMAPYCSGIYSYSAEPTSNTATSDTKSTLAHQPAVIAADQIVHGLNGGSRMLGSIEIRQGSRLVTADTLTIGEDQRRLELQDHIEIADAEMVLLAKQAVIDLDGNRSKLEGAYYLLLESGMRGTASFLERDDTNRVKLRQGSFSSCEPNDNSWVFYADNIELDLESGFGSAKHMHLEVAGLPVFYAPYIYFPIDDQRHTGFLMPSFGSSSEGGFEIVTPYYVNLASNYDLTLTPRFMSKRGLLLDTEFRYLGSKYHGRLDLGILPGDRGDINPTLGLSENPDRWLVGWHHSQQIAEGWSSEVEFNRVSDIDYFRDLEFSGLISGNPNHLGQTARLNYDSNHWGLVAQYQRYQTVDLDLLAPYGTEPRLTADGQNLIQQMTGAYSPVELNLTTEYTDFYRDNTSLTGADRVNGKRSVFMPSLTYPMELSSGYIHSTAKFWYLSYDLVDQASGQDAEPEVAVPVYSLDAGLALERSFQIAGQDWLQILEPRIYFLDVEHQDQSSVPNFDSDLNRFSYAQLFRENRFTGSDRIGDTRQLSLALSTQLIDSNGRRALDAGVGRIFYFKDRAVMLSGTPSASESASHSPVAGYLRFATTDKLDLTLSAAATGDKVADADMQLLYKQDERHLVRLGHRYNRADGTNEQIEQSSLSTVWGLDDRWTLLAHWDYDVAQNRTLDAVAGLQYDECCWMVSAYARRWISDGNISGVGVASNNAVFFQFQLKGFAGIGEKLEQIIRSRMPGF